MLPTISFFLSGHLLSGSILNYLLHSKDAECILMFLSAMPRGVSVALELKLIVACNMLDKLANPED